MPRRRSFPARALRIALLGGIALASLWSATPAGAQNGEETKAPSLTEAITGDTGPVAIPISAIASEAASLDAFLKGIESSFEAPESQTRIREQLPELEKDVRARARRLAEKLEYTFDRTDLDAMRSAWKGTRTDLSRWEAALGTRLTTLRTQEREIEDRTATWKLTAESAREEAAPASVRAQIDEALLQLRTAMGRLRKARDAALGLQRSVIALKGRVSDQLEAIQQAEAEVLRHVLRRGAAPVWELELGDFGANRESFGLALEEARSSLREYASKHVPLLVLHALLIVALVFACLRSRRSARRDDSHPLPPGLVRPIAAGLLLGLTASVWLHPDAPPKFGLLLVLIALPFWYVVLRSVVPESLRQPVVGLAIAMPVEVARDLLVDFDTLARVLLVVQCALFFGGLVWLRRPSRLGAVPRDAGSLFWARILSAWMHFALIASGIALLGAIGGWTTASDIGISAVADGTFMASIMFTAVRVVEGMAAGSAFSGQLHRVRMIHHDPEAFLRVVRRGGRTIAFVTWVDRLLDYLSIHGPVMATLGSLLAAPLGYGNFQVTLGGLIAFGLTLWISWLLSRFVSTAMEQEVFSRVDLPRGVPFALSTIGRYVVLVLGFVTAVAMVGVEVGNLALLVSALGVGIGFGMQNVVNNFISGLILLFERPIKVNDLVSVDTLMGRVQRIGIRASVVRTFDGADVIVPNGDLISGRVTNWTLADTRRRISLPVGVVYGTPAPRVLELLSEVARANPEVLDDPEPVALFTGFGDSSLDFELRAWTESEDALTLVRSALATAVQAALQEAGIEVPFPQRDLHIRTLPASKPEREPEGASEGPSEGDRHE